jgi:hypothetical protein
MTTNTFYQMLQRRQKHFTWSIILASGAIVVLLFILKPEEPPVELSPFLPAEKVRYG